MIVVRKLNFNRDCIIINIDNTFFIAIINISFMTVIISFDASIVNINMKSDLERDFDYKRVVVVVVVADIVSIFISTIEYDFIIAIIGYNLTIILCLLDVIVS